MKKSVIISVNGVSASNPVWSGKAWPVLAFFFGASTLAFAALAASYYGDSDYNPRIISILPQSDQALRADSHYGTVSAVP